MCRSIKVLRNSEPASPADIEAAALQFVRKISGMRRPSRRNEEPFAEALRDITTISQRMLEAMDLKPAPREPRPQIETVLIQPQRDQRPARA